MKNNNTIMAECRNMFEIYSGNRYEQGIEENLLYAFSSIGIHIDDLYSETDPSKLRLLLSELIMKRYVCSFLDSKDYILACNYLLCFIECFDTPNKNKEKQPKVIERKLQNNDVTYDANSAPTARFFR